MKTIIIAALAATVSTAAFAGNFDGSISAADFAAQHFAQDHSQGDGPRGVYSVGSNEIISTKGGNVAQFAADHFAQSHSEGDGPRRAYQLTSEAEIVSTKSSNLTAFAIEKLSNGPEDRR